jgi:transcription elongation factor Elf1
MIHKTSITCPVCGPGTVIEVEISSMLQGARFCCPACGSQVGIHQESVEMAKRAIDQFENLKKKSSKGHSQISNH